MGMGENGDGQLGSGDLDSRSDPAPVPALYQMPLKGLAAGACHSLALTRPSSRSSCGG